MTSGRSKPVIVGGSGGQQRKQIKGAASNQSTQALPAFPSPGRRAAAGGGPRAAGRGPAAALLSQHNFISKKKQCTPGLLGPC